MSESVLRERVAHALHENDLCGPGPVSVQEYLDDAQALLDLVAQAIRDDAIPLLTGTAEPERIAVLEDRVVPSPPG